MAHMSLSSRRHFATGLVEIATGMLLCGCGASGGTARVETMVRAEPSGLSLVLADVGGRSRIVIEAHDYTGTSEKLSWQIPNIQLTPAYKQLVACVEDIRAKQTSDESAYTQPYFLRSAALHCVQTSGMPPPEVMAKPTTTKNQKTNTKKKQQTQQHKHHTNKRLRPV